MKTRKPKGKRGGADDSRSSAENDGARLKDPERTRADIIDVATRVFSEKGLSGARIDEIADQTHTSKRMIYYYFESKDGLYLAVLENCYRRIRAIETGLDLAHQPPMKALAQLVRFTFDYQLANTDFIRLVMVENIHHGVHITQLPDMRKVNADTIETLRRIIARGVAENVMRPDLDPVDLHMSISALSFFNVSNRHTFSTIFNVDMTSPTATAARRESITAMILRFVVP